jgi:protein-S-isoprenylcysteine O-methyltransferase Ste14
LIAREIDFPPVWLAGFALVSAGVGRVFPVAVPFAHEAGGLIVALALLLMLGAILQMLRWRTTVIPGRDPRQLLTHGLFRLSRNPIYLADAILLAGLSIFWGAWLALPLVGVFMYVIHNRFILPEEARLGYLFGEEYADYKNQTRRWI